MSEPAIARQALIRNGVTGMSDACAPVIELAEAEALRVRVHARQLKDEDYSLVERIITAWISPAVIMRHFSSTQSRNLEEAHHGTIALSNRRALLASRPP